VTQAGGLDLDQDLAMAGLGRGHLVEAEKLGEIVDDGSLHETLHSTRGIRGFELFGFGIGHQQLVHLASI
jgi:hypothetical protein